MLTIIFGASLKRYKSLSYLWNLFLFVFGWLLTCHRCPVDIVTNPLLILELWLRAEISIRLTVVILLESLRWKYRLEVPVIKNYPWSDTQNIRVDPQDLGVNLFSRVGGSWWTWSCSGKVKEDFGWRTWSCWSKSSWWDPCSSRSIATSGCKADTKLSSSQQKTITPEL